MTIEEDKQYTTVKAKYNPKNMEALPYEIEDLVGETGEFMYSWIIKSGKHKGQWAMVPRGKSIYVFDCEWIPECDLQILGVK